jgi:hypothetical protein
VLSEIRSESVLGVGHKAKVAGSNLVYIYVVRSRRFLSTFPDVSEASRLAFTLYSEAQRSAEFFSAVVELSAEGFIV